MYAVLKKQSKKRSRVKQDMLPNRVFKIIHANFTSFYFCYWWWLPVSLLLCAERISCIVHRRGTLSSMSPVPFIHLSEEDHHWSKVLVLVNNATTRLKLGPTASKVLLVNRHSVTSPPM